LSSHDDFKDSVVKIFHNSSQNAVSKFNKIEAMVEQWSPEIETVAAWPRQIVYSSSPLEDSRVSAFCGFVMKSVVGYSVFDVWNPEYRVKKIPFVVDFAFLCRVSSNIASVVGLLHSKNIVIGDINPNSFRVNKQGMVTSIDCDSFQISSGASSGNPVVFRCEVGFGSYQPPEILSRGTFDLVRGTENDLFGLAVVIFQTLFLGRHPYMGVVDENGDTYDVEEAIEENLYPYSLDGKKVSLAKNALRLDPSLFSKELGNLFDACFSEGRTRSLPEEWILGFRNFEKTSNVLLCRR